MNENTRKHYIAQGGEFEKVSEYEKALASYLEAFSIKECSKDDEKDFFKPGFIEDKIAFLAYCLGDYRTSVTFGGKAYRAAPEDQRIKNNLQFYTDGILITNPKERLDDIIDDYIIKNYSGNYTALDIGPYDGRWSDSLRNNFKQIDAVEAFEPYVERFNLKQKYDNIFISDIREFEFEYYDLIIMGDVLEHLPVDDAQKLIERLYPKCKQLIIIIPYEYPQDEYDDNEYQIHYQEDLTDEIFMERYPGFTLLTRDEVRGAYIKKDSDNVKETILSALDDMPKTYRVGMNYFNSGNYNIAAGVFLGSVEKMDERYEAMKDYNLGICYKNMDKSMEALKAFTSAVETTDNFRDAFFEIFKILEKNELWEDLEHYLKLALDEKEKTSLFKSSISDWESLIFIQLTLALSKQRKLFEAYGFAALSLDSKMNDERRKIAEYNYNELKKELWSTLQI